MTDSEASEAEENLNCSHCARVFSDEIKRNTCRDCHNDFCGRCSHTITFSVKNKSLRARLCRACDKTGEYVKVITVKLNRRENASMFKRIDSMNSDQMDEFLFILEAQELDESGISID